MYKKLILTTALGLVFFAGESLAEDCNLTYKLQGDTYVVTGASNKTTCTSVNVPSEYNGKPVASINQDAFFNTGALKSVVIPESVTSIGNAAFKYTPNLSDVTIKGDNVSITKETFFGSAIENLDYKSVTYSCGDNCAATLSQDGSITFTGEGTLKSTSAPSGFNSYSSVYIDGFSNIGTYSFQGNRNIKEVVLSDDVTTISPHAFNASSLESIIMSDSVTTIGEAAFFNIGTLKSVVIPESVISIGNAAFEYTPNLSSIYCSILQQDLCKEAARGSGKNVNIVGSYKKKGKYILYYDYTGKLMNKGPNPSYKPRKIYTVEEAMEATKDGDKFHVYLTYK